MKTREWLEKLTKNPGRALRFALPSGRLLPEEFHLTEVKNLRIDSVDCGGKRSQWNETVFQIWAPEGETDPAPITTDKAVKILNKAYEISPMDPGAESLFEVEDETGTAVSYRPADIESDSTQVIIHLGARKTECKALSNGGTCGPQACAPQSAIRIAGGCCG